MADLHITGDYTTATNSSNTGQTIYGDGVTHMGTPSASLMRSSLSIQHDNCIVQDLTFRYDTNTALGSCLEIYSAAGTIVRRCVIDVNRLTSKQGISISGANTSDLSTNTLIEDSIIRGVGSAADFTNGNKYFNHNIYPAYASGVTLRNCLIYDCWAGFGLHLSGSGAYPTNITVENCLFVDNKCAVYMGYINNNVIFDKCIFAFNGVGAVFGFPQMRTGLYLTNPTDVDNYVVTDSRVWGNQTTDYYQDTGSGDSTPWAPDLTSTNPNFTDRSADDYTNNLEGYGPDWLFTGVTPPFPPSPSVPLSEFRALQEQVAKLEQRELALNRSAVESPKTDYAKRYVKYRPK